MSQKPKLIKQELDEWLNSVNYKDLNSGNYQPTEFALAFMNMIKLINGEAGEANKTPTFHLKMLDKVMSGHPYVANLCFRGAGKTAVFIEYFVFYLALFNWLEGLGKVDSLIYVSDSMDNGVKSARKNIEFRYNNSEFLQRWIPVAKFTDNYMEFKNAEGGILGVKMFGAKTGLRGTKIFGKRPIMAVLDDLVSDEDANSQLAMQAIKDTVYKGVNHALDPTRRKVIFNGTPFNKTDILIEAVESGQWDVNVWPVCEKFPVDRADFQGAWADRFSYDYIKSQYDLAVGTGKTAAFYQELMLRISSEDERLVQDGEIRWYNRKNLIANKHAFNFYITTDFAVSKKKSADNSVISVWAYNANGDWFWVDGVAERQTMDVTVNDLFRLVQEYQPLQVGIEVTGQQGGFIPWLQTEMFHRNIWFNFASSSSSGEPGIRPVVDKLQRFNLIVPWFKAGKFYWPEEMKTTPIMGKFMQGLRLATINGLKGKDDTNDTISMLGYLKPWKPNGAAPATPTEVSLWDDEVSHAPPTSLSSYIV